MIYYLQEMHGSFVQLRLLRMPDKENLPDKDEVAGEYILAHCMEIPEIKGSRNWFVGSELTADGHLMGGHHVGRYIKISKQEATNILTEAVNNF